MSLEKLVKMENILFLGMIYQIKFNLKNILNYELDNIVFKHYNFNT